VKKPNGHAIGEPFSPLIWRVIDSPEFASLSSRAVHILVLLLRRYNGFNNRKIVLGCREAATLCRCDPTTAARALRELVAARIITAIHKGHIVLGADLKRATVWQINFIKETNDDRIQPPQPADRR
jgi:hypothetical protein